MVMKHQTIGMHVEAERIYRNILREDPSHPYALHLLGLIAICATNILPCFLPSNLAGIIYYQKGQPVKAITYIEQALSAFGHEVPKMWLLSFISNHEFLLSTGS